MNNKYKIVYGGSLKAGTDPEQFIQQFMQVFKVPEANARKLVTLGHAVTLKTKLDQEQAEKVREAMASLGMQVHVELMASESPAADGGAVPSQSTPSGAAGQGPRCPKCGSERINGDDCLACGIIISKYRERQARLAAEAASKAEATVGAADAEDAAAEEPSIMSGPRKVPAGNAWRWIAHGWDHFRQNPFAWLGALFVWMLLMGVMAVIPLVGFLATSILGPVFAAGFVLGANEQREGGDFEVRHLFAGFAAHTGPLALVGALYLVGTMAIFAVVAMIFGGSLLAMGGGLDLDAMLGTILIMVLLVTALMIPLLMAYWFAPALVVLGGFSPIDAMKASFVACVKNTVPFLVYGLLVFVLAIVAMIPFGLGFFALVPVVMASVFTSYRDIFYTAEDA